MTEADLGELAAIANKYHEMVEVAGKSMLESAWKAGQALLAAKELCEHGSWLSWLEAEFHGTDRTAQRYMRIARNTTCVSDLDPSISINAALDAISEKAEADKAEAEAKTSAKAKGNGKSGKTPTMPCEKFGRRHVALSDDILFIVENVEKDKEFAAAAFNELEDLTKLRDALTKLIQRLRKQF